MSFTLKTLLSNGLNALGLPKQVDIKTPDDFKTFSPGSTQLTTIFLYHVAMSTEVRNQRPRAGSSGSSGRTPLPLELRYLITPWTSAATDSHRLVGAVAQLLYANCILTGAQLQQFPPGGPTTWNAEDTVELILESLPVEEHYDIWDPTDIPYKLSLTYLARVVGIDPPTAAAGPIVNVASAGP